MAFSILKNIKVFTNKEEALEKWFCQGLELEFDKLVESIVKLSENHGRKLTITFKQKNFSFICSSMR